jgi:hypothetical protein
MQYGGAQLYGAVKEYMDEHPGTPVLVTPAWANGPDILARFFSSDPLPFQLGNIESYMNQYIPIDEKMVFVMTPDEYQRANSSGKFTDIRIEQTLPYPNGMPGFYFVRMRYMDNILEILEADRQARRQLRSAEVSLDGRPVSVRHSMLDMGQIQEIFDGNTHTLARTLEANPFIIELTFPGPRPLSGLTMIIGDTRVQVLARLYPSLDSPPVEFTFELEGSVQQPMVSKDFDQVYLTQVLYLEITDMQQSEPGHVHLWELIFR